MNHVVLVQAMATSRKRGVAAPSGSEPVRAGGERRLVVCLQQQAHHLTDELVRPGRQAQRTQFPVLFLDIHASNWGEPVALVAHRLDDGTDLLHGRAVRGFWCGAGCHRPVVGVDPPVRQQIQLRVEQLSIQLGTRQTLPAAFAEDTKYRFGVLHFAYVPVLRCPITCAPSPCRRRYRFPGRS